MSAAATSDARVWNDALGFFYSSLTTSDVRCTKPFGLLHVNLGDEHLLAKVRPSLKCLVRPAWTIMCPKSVCDT